MVEEVKIVGGGAELDGAVLRGAATEATLKQLVDKLGAGSKGAQDATNMAKKNMTDVAKSAKGATGAFDDYVESHKKFSSTLQDFGVTLIKGSDQFADYTSSLTGYVSQFGKGFGLLAQVIQRAVNELDSQIKMFRELSTVGADFGDSIFGSRLASIEAGISLDVFSKNVQANSTTLALLGGSVNQGIMRFKNISGVVQKTMQPQFSRLGINLEETTDYLTDYLEIQTNLGRAQKMSDAELAAGTADYIMQLDLLSRVTGQSRAEAAKLLKAQQADAAFQMLLLGLPEEARMSLKATMATLENASPDIAKAARSIMISGGATITDEAIGLANANRNLIPILADMSKGQVGRTTELFSELSKTGEMEKKRLEQSGRGQAFIYEMTGNKIFSMGQATIPLININKNQAQATKEQTAATKAESKAALDFSNQMTKLKNSLIQIFMPFLNVVVDVANYFAKVVTGLVNFLNEWPKTMTAIGTVSTVLGGIALAGLGLIGVFKMMKAGMALGGGIKQVLGGGAAASVAGGGAGGKVLEGLGKSGGGIGESLKGLAKGLTAFGVGGAAIIKGAGVLALVIGILGGGAFVGLSLIAAGFALTGMALSKFATGLSEVAAIDGGNLKDVASGVMDLSAAMGKMAGGGIASGFASFLGAGPKDFAKNINVMLDSLDKGKIDSYTVAFNKLGDSLAGMNTNMQKTMNASSKDSGDKLDQLNNTMNAVLNVLQTSKRYQRDTAEGVNT